MIDRKLRWTLWIMLGGMLLAFVGVFIYASIHPALGHGVGIAGVLVMGVGIALNIAISFLRHCKNDSEITTTTAPTILRRDVMGTTGYAYFLDGQIRSTSGDVEFSPLLQFEASRVSGSIYPVSNGNRGLTYGRFFVSGEVWQDGNICILVGPHIGLPGPIADAGDATPNYE